MPKNTIIPAAGGPGPAPPVAEQSIRFDRTRATNLRGYTPAIDESPQWVMSWWQKITGDLTVDRTIWEARVDASNFTRFRLLTTGAFQFQGFIAGVQEAFFETKRFMVDVSNWHHIHLRFSPPTAFLQFSINGYGYPSIQQVPFTTANNVPGYVWMNTTAEHVIGSDDANIAGASAYIAEMHCVPGAAQPLRTAFGVFNANGVWERIVYAGGHGTEGFYLTFGRTVDLGEDFSGNANDFTVHTNAAAGGGDQADDWMEKNYCTLDVNDPRSTGTISDGALEVAGGNAAVTMRPDFGVWYYELNGVATVFDTGVSGQFDPVFVAGSSLNFGQFPFVDVGPSGGELTLNSNNFPATSTDNARDYMAAIEYAGDDVTPKVITDGTGQATIYDIEYADIIHRVDLLWNKGNGPGRGWFQAHRLRVGAQIRIDTTGAEETVNASGVITDLPDPGPGFEVTAGGVDNLNHNAFGQEYNPLSLHVRAYGLNILLAQDLDSAEETTIDGPQVGDTTTSSSDLEMVESSGFPVQEVGLRYQNVDIPQGAQIVSAHIQFEADEADAGTDDMLMFCEDIDNAPVFVDGANNFNITNRTKTSPGVAWSPADWNVVQARTAVQLTSSFASELQQVIDRAGWARGNSLVWIVAEDTGGTRGQRTAEANLGTNVPELQVRYRTPGVEADSLVSLFTYEGIGIARDVMHGNNNIPDLIALKNLAGGSSWSVYCSAIVTAGAPEDGHLSFDTTAAYTASANWDNTAPGGTFFRVGTAAIVNNAGDEYAGFSVANLRGFSKVFRYVGNNSLNGPEVYLGFKPRWLCIKRTGAAENWVTMHKATGIIDAQNNQFNLMDSMGFLNTDENFFQNLGIEAYSSGFKVRDLDTAVNGAAQEYVGFAFAEAGFPNAKATN